ncbi:hypothetical protein THTE_0278 [Thermogutta terrifontis]|uniref:Uncharacterized protein n=1 Tax=Thermogutta terrifontis TaxID=1331910 RepID=A0A286RAA8_9BACT|nr:hypothetical protein THTE_0278 [Thermogutta terrifontis]
MGSFTAECGHPEKCRLQYNVRKDLVKYAVACPLPTFLQRPATCHGTVL